MTMFVLCLIYCIILENNSNIKAIEQFENWFRKQTKYTFPFLFASCYRINLFQSFQMVLELQIEPWGKENIESLALSGLITRFRPGWTPKGHRFAKDILILLGWRELQIFDYNLIGNFSRKNKDFYLVSARR